MKKFPYFLRLIFLYISLIKTYIFTKECSNEDVGSYLTKCDENNKRKIFFYWINECTQSATYSLPLMIDNINCNKTCNPGMFLTFDISKMELVCKICPAGTYSVGGNYRICGEKREWITEVLSKFKNICHTVKILDEDNLGNKLSLNSMEKNTNHSSCESWKINDYNTNITTGGTSEQNSFYVAQLKYSVEMKNNGSIMFGYVKNTVMDGIHHNGQFKFFIDYEEKIHDRNLTNNFTDLSFDLESGMHSFMWVYYYKTDDKNSQQNLSMQLKYIMINGIDNSAYECTKCPKGFSKEGWDHCETCPSNQYLDESFQECKDCPSDKFSYPNSIGINSCLTKPDCNKYDYVEIHSECIDNQKNVTHKISQPIFCNFSNMTLPKDKIEKCDDSCPDGYFKDINSDSEKRCYNCLDNYYTNSSTIMANPYSCFDCPENHIAGPKIFNITKFHNIQDFTDKTFCTNECYSEFYSGLCDVFNYTGWRFRNDGVIPGNNLPFGVKFTLTKNINITRDDAYIEIGYEILDLKEEEYFYILLDENIVHGLDVSQGQHKFKISLSLGEHLLKIIYQKRRPQSGILNLKNPLIIKSFLLFGSDEGGATYCLKKQKNEIINSPLTSDIIFHQFDFTEAICPDYMYLHTPTKRCQLLDVLHNRQNNLKFIIGGLRSNLDKICETDSSELCYNKHKFLGPVHDLSKNDVYFISFYQNDKISVEDFSYVKDKYSKDIGFIFGLFEHKSYTQETNSQLLNSSYYLFNNIKKIKNLGSKMSKIILNPGRPEIQNMNPGVIIKYSDGDECQENHNLNYTSYIFFSCDKSGYNSPPKLVEKLVDKCVFIFEWESRFACPSCLEKDLVSTKTGCLNNNQYILYEENLNCIIEDGNNLNLIGKNKAFENEKSIFSFDTYKTEELVFNTYLLKKNYTDDVNKFGAILKLKSESSKNIFPQTTDKKYIEKTKEKIDCVLEDAFQDPYSNYTDLSSSWLIVIPLIYIITTICLIFFYCKYRRINYNYDQLRQEVEFSNMTDRREDSDNNINNEEDDDIENV